MDINRKTAYQALLDVEKKKSYSNLTLNNKIDMNKPDSPAFVRELVYGVLERKITLDYYIDTLAKKGVRSLKAPELTILRMGIYQLSFMDSVPEYAAVNESVALAKKFCRGKEGFINGMLRHYRRTEIELPDDSEDLIRYLSVKYSYEPWIIHEWLRFYDREFTEKLLEAGNGTPPMTVRVNELKISRADLIRALTDAGFEAEEGSLCDKAVHVKGSGLLDTDLYRAGLFTPQDESSMLVAEFVDPKPGEIVMDVCAAPGGKTTAIAEKMNNEGRVVASDVYSKKLNQIVKAGKRLGITNIETRQHDASKVDADYIGLADRVLADAPCSGLGVVRRKPEIKYKEKEKEMKKLPEIQMEILMASSTYVKSGGTLVYSTCTIYPPENELLVEEFLSKNPAFEMIDSKLLLPHVDGTDGFFICAMRKTL